MKKPFLVLYLGLLLAAINLRAQVQFPPAGTSAAFGHAYPRYFQGHATLSNALLAYWPLTEASGTRYDVVGGYNLDPQPGNALTVQTIAGSLNGTGFPRTQDEVVDMVITANGTTTVTFSSASADLVAYPQNTYFALLNHNIYGGTWMVTSAPSTSSFTAVRADRAVVSTSAPSEAASTRTSNWLGHGFWQLSGFGGFAPTFGQFQDSAIHVDGRKGASLSFWIRIPTGAPVGKNYFSNGVVFAASLACSDANSTQLNLSCSFVTVGSAAQAVCALPLPALDTWYFYVVTYDPSTRQATCNRNAGAATNTGAAATGLTEFDVNYEFGAGYLEIGGAYRGVNFGGQDIGQVGLWNRVLTGAEITYLYNAGAGRPITP